LYLGSKAATTSGQGHQIDLDKEANQAMNRNQSGLFQFAYLWRARGAGHQWGLFISFGLISISITAL